MSNVQVNLVAGNGYLYPMSVSDLDALRRSGIGFTRFPSAPFDWMRDQYRREFKFIVHTVDDAFGQIVSRMVEATTEDAAFQSVQWKHLVEDSTPRMSTDLAFIVYYGEGNDEVLQSLTRSGREASSENAAEKAAIAEARGDEFASTFKHYMARYQIAVRTQKRLRPDLGGIAYKFDFSHDPEIANDTFYGEPGVKVTEAILKFSHAARLLLKIETPHDGTNNVGMGPSLAVAIQTLHGDRWESNPATVRSYPLRMLDRGSIPDFITFLASHLS